MHGSTGEAASRDNAQEELAIIIPTHNRQKTLQYTVESLLLEHQALGISARVHIFDSSKEISSIKLREDVSITHCPDLSFYEKQQLCLEYVNIHLENVRWILFCPDDDIYVPTLDLARLIRIVDGSILHAYIPCRYIFFSRDQYIESLIRIREAWSHHVCISSRAFDAMQRLSKFASQGVAAYWGYFSRKAFVTSLNLRIKVAHSLPESSHNFIEDVSNLLSLSYEWHSLGSYPLAIRGDDRRSNQSTGWRASWLIWDELTKSDFTQDGVSSILALLRDAISKVLSEQNCHPSILYSLTRGRLSNLVSEHVEGYRNASSRVHSASQAFLLPRRSDRSTGSGKPHFFPRDKSKQFFDILLPEGDEAIDTTIYNGSMLISSSHIVNSIYKHRDFMFSDRCL